jgi:hypothetical protein
LYVQKETLEDEIKEDFEELKESLKPLNLIKDMFRSDKHQQSSQLSSNNHSPAVAPAVATYIGSALLDLVISKLMFNKNSYIKKVIASYLIYATGPSMIQRLWPAAVNKFKQLFNNVAHKENSHPGYERSTAGSMYND